MSRLPLPIAALLFGLLGFPLQADDRPLHQQIDSLIDSARLGPIAAQADDSTFLRRISLDLIGRIPTRAELEDFLNDNAVQKRGAIVDRLLESPEFPRHMAVVLDLMLMERRGNKHVKTEAFRSFLESAVQENRPFNELVRQILAADGTEDRMRAAAAFYLEREVEPHLLTRDVGRIFFGIDLQCAQCHDHPLIDDYYQPDYYGLHAFFVRSSLFRPDNKKPALIAELATGEANFKSVFTDREGMIRPRIPGGNELIEVTLKPPAQYQVAPAKDVRPVPTMSRLQQLAKVIAEEPSEAFRRNIANRLWAHMFGRGLVHPVDLHHSSNPATYPAVLDLIATEFGRSNYNIRWLLRELALTQTYQRTFRLESFDPDPEQLTQQVEAATRTAEAASQQALESEQQLYALFDKLDQEVTAAKPIREAEAAATKKLAEAITAVDEAQARLMASNQEYSTARAQSQLLEAAVTATAAAAEAFEADTGLAAALQTIQDRATSHAETVKTLQDQVTSNQAKLAASEATLTETSQAADEAIAARNVAEDTVRSLRSDVFTAREETTLLRTQASIARRRITYLESLLDYDQSREQTEQLRSTLRTRTDALAAIAAEVASTQRELSAARSAYERSLEESDSQQQNLERVAKTRDGIQNTKTQLETAIANAEQAAKTLVDQSSISEAVSLLEETLQNVSTKLEATEVIVAKEQEAAAAKRKNLAAHQSALQSLTNARKAAEHKQTRLQSAQAADRKLLSEAYSRQQTHWETVIEEASARAHVAQLVPLSPEQLALSMLVATGQDDRQRAAEAAKLDKEKPLSDEQASDPTALADRQRQIDLATEQALQAITTTFVRLYGAGAGQPQNEFFATAEQSLFAANGNVIRSWLRPSGDNLTGRLLRTDEPADIARELYLSVLSRPPTDDEIADVTRYLDNRPDEKSAAVQELAWGLLTSAEFRFRH